MNEKLVFNIGNNDLNVTLFELAQKIQKLIPDSKIIEDLGADSLNVVELVMAFETEYDIQITDEDAENIITVADAKRYIEEYS